MSTVDMPTEIRVEHLLNSVKQLLPVEFDEFTKKLAEWQQQQKRTGGVKIPRYYRTDMNEQGNS